MPEFDGAGTERDLQFGIAAELAAAGFDDAVEIGRGGFGVVYRCAETSLNRTVAVKVLTSEVHGDERDRFIREQRALGRLSGHPHIVQILQVDITATGRPFIVMPFHSHGSLEARLRTVGPLGWAEATSIGVKLAGALSAAHGAGIVHRDVKPANVLVTDYGEPQLADFGIAHVSDGFQTTAGRIAGTPAFTAPEMLTGDAAGPAADIYGLGATLFCLLTGHASFERRTGETVVAQFVRITTAPVPDLGDLGIPGDLGALIGQAKPTELPETRTIGSRSGLSIPVAGAPPPIVSTRFRPPTPPRPLIDRPRVLDIVRNGGHRRLTLIHAPAGFGKSTLAAQWGHSLASESISVAWLAVDAADDNVVWFVAHLVEAIRRARPELARDLSAILEERSGGDTRHVLAALIDEVHDSGEPIVVVLDDWHRVTSRPSVAAMAYLLEHGCHHLRFIVTSRTQAGLPVSRLRVCDELVEVDAEDLRFDVGEAQSFLVDVNGLVLDRHAVAGLQQSTDGWAAALQLAALSLR